MLVNQKTDRGLQILVRTAAVPVDQPCDAPGFVAVSDHGHRATVQPGRGIRLDAVIRAAVLVDHTDAKGGDAAVIGEFQIGPPIGVAQLRGASR